MTRAWAISDASSSRFADLGYVRRLQRTCLVASVTICGLIFSTSPLEGKAADARFITKGHGARSLFDDLLDHFVDLPYTVGDRQFDETLLAGQLQGESILVFVGVHGDIRYTVFHDRFLSWYAARLPQGNNPR